MSSGIEIAFSGGMGVDKHVWEHAEIERSTSEAAHTSEALTANEANVARYVNPPQTTVYPLQYAYSLLGDVTGRTVLDFGCGSGDNCLLLARRGARVIGVDISESLIRLGVRRLRVNGLAGSAQFIVGSCHDLPVHTASVDVVFGIAVLHHLDLSATSREIHRVLKPGGRGIFQEPVRDSSVVRFVRKLIPYRAPDVSPFERPLTTPELDSFSAPFLRRAVRAFSLPFVNLTEVVRPLRKYVHAAYRLDGRIIKRMPRLQAFSAIRVFEVVKQ